LLEGETGTGKTTFARWLHANGTRRDAELVVVNCAALPENLAESELFGHEKGAFTDAKAKRIGLFEAADGGTLFLDEIASLSPALQAKVLVAIEEGKIRRVGGVSEILVDARVIAASNRDLDALAREGAFREDLFHRLNLLHIRIPPLRERKEDLMHLVEHLGRGLSHRYQIDRFTISEEGKKQILTHDWPGNIRELTHEVERAIILGDPSNAEFPLLSSVAANGISFHESYDSDWLNPHWDLAKEGIDLEMAIDRLIDMAIEKSAGNVSEAARFLKVPRDYIRYRKKKKTS
jgi:DNA-binding NtrC family response regulator